MQGKKTPEINNDLSHLQNDERKKTKSSEVALDRDGMVHYRHGTTDGLGPVNGSIDTGSSNLLYQ